MPIQRELRVARELVMGAAFAALALLAGPSALASVEVGVGLSSVHEGRAIPALRATYGENWVYSLHSSGTRTSVYAQNAWSASVSRLAQQGDLGWLKFDLNIGGAFALIDRRYRTSTTSEISSQSEFVVGPSATLRWRLGPVVLGFEAIFGLRPSLQHLALNFQDVTHVTLGVRW